MKRLILLLTVIFALTIGASVSFAYDPPSQGTDNATDIIIWHGDNVTVTGLESSLSIIANALSQQGVPIVISNNVAVTITDLETALTAASEALADIIADSIISVAESFLLFIIVAALLALAFWQKSLFLYILACPVGLVYGLSLASGETPKSPMWVAGVVIAIIGTSCLYKVVIAGLEGMGIKVRRK